MTTPPDPPGLSLGTLAGTVAALAQRAADDRRRHDTAMRDLAAQVERLAATFTAAVDQAAPKGPPAPRLDNLDKAGYAREVERTRAWVDGILLPWHIRGGPYTLADCWDRHPPVVLELATAAAWWRWVYDQDRPSLPKAMDWFDRFLPSVMRHADAATRSCATGHRA